MDPRKHHERGQGQRQRQPQPSNGQHQRFSWQTPPETPPEQEQEVQPRRPSPNINTNVNSQGRAFSYAQTPIEHRAPNHYTSAVDAPPLPHSPPTPIDPRPQSIFDPHNPHAAQSQPHPASGPTYPSQPYEKTPLSPVSPQTTSPQYPTATAWPVSPISEPTRPYPHANPHTQIQTNHARQLSHLSPINTNLSAYPMPPIPPTPDSQASALPQKTQHTPITPLSAAATKNSASEYPLSAASRKSFPITEPYSPHGFTPSHAGPGGARTVFSPDAAHGPNGLDTALHQPGQSTHPNMEHTPSGSNGARAEWKHSLLSGSDVSTCATGLFCPCVLYGRTSYRLAQKSAKKDPTDMLGYSATNASCVLMALSCGLWWVYPLVQHVRVRHVYKLGGSCVGDVVKGCCCCCCLAVQNEREVREREESARRWAGPASTEVYTAPGQMVYSPQR